MIEKPDASDFRRHLATLREQWRNDREKSWWPNYGFHFTDIRNAVSILKSDRLLSRVTAKALIDTFADGASAQILDRTDEKWKEYVRFYFRPQTPTLYRNEGFISNPDNTPLKAHCPVPVYFLFDLEALLCRSDTCFSNGNLASDHARVYSTALELQNFLPDFQSVYHTGPFDSVMPEGWDIKFSRQAEIVVHDQIDLTDLKKVICRSQAEYELDFAHQAA